MFFVFAKTTTIGSEICSPFLALKKLLLPLSHRVAWDEGCPIAAQASTSQCVIVVKQEIWADAVPAWNHWQRPEERFPRIVADRLFHGTKNQAEKKLILEERIPSRRYSWRRGYPAYSSDGEFVSEFHSCPLALRSGHSRKQNRAISSCGSTNY